MIEQDDRDKPQPFLEVGMSVKPDPRAESGPQNWADWNESKKAYAPEPPPVLAGAYLVNATPSPDTELSAEPPKDYYCVHCKTEMTRADARFHKCLSTEVLSADQFYCEWDGLFESSDNLQTAFRFAEAYARQRLQDTEREREGAFALVRMNALTRELQDKAIESLKSELTAAQEQLTRQERHTHRHADEVERLQAEIQRMREALGCMIEEVELTQTWLAGDLLEMAKDALRTQGGESKPDYASACQILMAALEYLGRQGNEYAAQEAERARRILQE